MVAKLSIQWFTDNGMQANPSKFQFMVISPYDDCAQSLVLNENTVLVSEKHVQVLGVIIDSKLNFSLHVSSMCKKAARQLNALARISNYLDESTVPLCGIFAESQTAIKLKQGKSEGFDSCDR